MNSFRLVLCLTGLLAYVVGRHFTSTEDVPVLLTGPGQSLTGAGLSVEKFDPGSLISKPAPAPAILKALPEEDVAPAEENSQLHVSTGATRVQDSGRPSHLTLNAAGTLK